MPGTNLNSAFTANSTTLWIREVEPIPTGANGYAYAISACCTGTPPTTTNLFRHGCLMHQLDSGTGNRAQFQNTGNHISPVWSLLDVAGLVPSDTFAYNLVSTAGAATYTAAQMLDAIMDRDGGATDRSDITASAALLVAGIPNVTVGSAFYFYLRNVSTTAGQKITVTAGSGVTISGNAVVYSNGATMMIGRVTNVGTPAVTLYVMADIDALQPAVEAASSVNTIQFSTSATGAAPSFTAVGSDTNIGVTLAGKGSGTVALGQATGSVNAFKGINYIASETGSNNAIAGALLDANGTAIPLQTGLEVTVKLGHTLQAGANTFNLNGGGAVNLKSHFNVANNIATPYAATGTIRMSYDGTQWVDMSQ